MTRHAHLVGSVGLSDAETVFATVAEELGACCSRIPDGETGARSHWVRWQKGTFEGAALLEAVGHKQLPGFNDTVERVFYKLKAGADPADLDFGELGYAREALASWTVFDKMVEAGRIGRDVRFQVALPTPVALLTTFVELPDRAACEPALERAMLKDLERIQAGIPNDRLSIQWDVCMEVLGVEGGLPLHYDDGIAGGVERTGRLCAAVAPDVELGIHLCYGDPGHKHIVEPPDLSVSVAFANGICKASPHPVAFMHMPVPRDRNDEAYFAPLKELDMPAETRLVLGLVHMTDGAAGTRARMATADRLVTDYDIATECGFGRREASTIPDLLRLHRELCEG